MSLWTPRDRVLRPPDWRGLVMPRQSAAPLDAREIDYDDLVIHRAWRAYEPNRPAEVRYFMYQLSQRDVGTDVYQSFYKAVRFLRVTRVPRYLRQVNGGTGAIYGQQRKLLSGLREQQVLFINLIAKSPHLPLVFAYGVQAVGNSIEEAQAACDQSYAVLQYLIDGVYQQLQYVPIRAEEAELLVRYQSQWRDIAMARGRPRSLGADSGIDAYLDGNRTDVENTQGMLDSFVRGMGDKSFHLSLVTVPVSPFELSGVWRNLARKLSEVRSEQSGARSVSAGFALPMALGAGFTDTHGTSHQAGHTAGTGQSDSVSHGDTVSLSHGVTNTQSQSVAHTDGTSAGIAHGTSLNEGMSAAHGTNHNVTEGVGLTSGASLSHGTSVSEGVGLTAGSSLSHGVGITEGVSASQSLGQSVSQGSSWSSGISDSVSASVNHAQSVANSMSQSLSQGISLGGATSSSIANTLNQANGTQTGSGGGLSIPGFGGLNMNLGQTAQQGTGVTNQMGASSSLMQSLTGGATQGTSLTDSYGQSMSHSIGLSESVGGNVTSGLSATNSVGQSVSQSQNVTAGQSMAVSQNLSQAQSMTAGQSLAASQNLSQGYGASSQIGSNVGAGTNLTQNAGVNHSDTSSYGTSTAQSQTSSVSATDGTAQAIMANQAYSAAYSSALSRAAQSTSSLGVVPNLGVTMSRNTYDEGKRVIGDLIEAQMQRYLEGIESGAYFYQMFLLCEDEHTLKGASGLLKSSFWGPGEGGKLPQPFHVTDRFDDHERDRLLLHAAAFTSYRRREASMDLVEPYLFSTYLTPSEGAVMTQPPTSESLGLLAVHDSMPVFAMPYDRADKDIYLGHIINGERGTVSDQPYSLDLDEIVHTLVAGATGSGKTTLLRRLVLEAVQSTRDVVDVDVTAGTSSRRSVPAGALILDWARSFRGLAATVEPHRFSFYCIAKPELGSFRFNPLALPDDGMNPVEWANAIADLFMIAFGLGEFARSIFYEKVAELYGANRLVPYVLRPEVRDEDGQLLRPAIELPAVDPATLRPSDVAYDPAGGQVANVYSCPGLSRLVSLEHLAVLVAASIEHQATREGRAMGGTNMQDRLQTVWRRVMTFAPGGALCDLFAADERLDEPRALRVQDLINPELGRVTVIEADGLDLANRKFVLGSVLQAVYRFGLFHGEGVFDQGGRGPGTFVIMEEAHELFGAQGDGEDRDAAATRVATYEAYFRRARQLGLKLVAAVQNPADVPNAILGNVGCIVSHQIVTEADKRVMASLFNWISGVGQQFRELRYLGEMAVGHCIIRLKARDNFLQAAPVHLAIDPPDLPRVDDSYLARRAA